MLSKISVVVLSVLLLASLGCGDGSDGDTNIVALGASDVTGVGASPVTNGYAYLIEKGIEERTNKKANLDNLGIPGAEISEIDNLEIQLLKLDSPDLITLSTGANNLIAGDPADQFESELNGLLGKIRSISPGVVVAVANLPDLTKIKRYVDNPDKNVTSERVAAYNAAIERQVRTFNFLLVDLFSTTPDNSLVSDADGFHPNDRGHRVIADRFLEVLNPFLDEIVNSGGASDEDQATETSSDN